MWEELLLVLSLAAYVSFDSSRQPGTAAGRTLECYSSPACLGPRTLSFIMTNANASVLSLGIYKFSRPWQWIEQQLSGLKCLKSLVLMVASAIVVADITASVATFSTALSLLNHHGSSSAITIVIAPSQQQLATQLHCSLLCLLTATIAPSLPPSMLPAIDMILSHNWSSRHFWATSHEFGYANFGLLQEQYMLLAVLLAPASSLHILSGKLCLALTNAFSTLIDLLCILFYFPYVTSCVDRYF